MDRERIQKRLAYWEAQLDALMDAYTSLVSGKVKSYKIDDRELTRLDLASLKKAINDAENKVDDYENMLNGVAARKTVGIVPRDW